MVLYCQPRGVGERCWCDSVIRPCACVLCLVSAGEVTLWDVMRKGPRLPRRACHVCSVGVGSSKLNQRLGLVALPTLFVDLILHVILILYSHLTALLRPILHLVLCYWCPLYLHMHASGMPSIDVYMHIRHSVIDY